jgi:hypothetical protein
MIPKDNKFDHNELVEPSISSLLTVGACFELVGLHRLKMLNLLRKDYEIAVRSRYPNCKPVECVIVINGMWKGVKYIYSGVRASNCIVGVNGSKHKICEGYDPKARHMDILLMLIRVNYKKYSINRIENTDVTMQKGYLHIEILEEFSDEYELYEFNP